jgi:hypothetical protein
MGGWPKDKTPLYDRDSRQTPTCARTYFSGLPLYPID